ncbi:MAG: HAD family phosphatase [Kiritimatiellaceae bacterium]|nr:HAD family phosphatase [Kiritimatiellaceae bacterium]
MISAIIFDFDGIIVDSERLHWAAFDKVLAPLGKTISWPDYFKTYIGFDDRDTFRHAFPGLGKPELGQLISKKAAAFQDLLESDGAAALPGSVDLIKHLSGNIPLAICSGALRADIIPILGSLGIENAFDIIVTADDTHISKPDPAPYKLAMKKLGVTSGLAIEDTPAGISSANGAGLKVLAVTNSYPAEALTMADAVVASLESLTLEKLNELM